MVCSRAAWSHQHHCCVPAQQQQQHLSSSVPWGPCRAQPWHCRFSWPVLREGSSCGSHEPHIQLSFNFLTYLNDFVGFLYLSQYISWQVFHFETVPTETLPPIISNRILHFNIIAMVKILICTFSFAYVKILLCCYKKCISILWIFFYIC